MIVMKMSKSRELTAAEFDWFKTTQPQISLSMFRNRCRIKLEHSRAVYNGHNTINQFIHTTNNWLAENTTGFYHFETESRDVDAYDSSDTMTIYFENDTDFAHYKLTFDGTQTLDRNDW